MVKIFHRESPSFEVLNRGTFENSWPLRSNYLSSKEEGRLLHIYCTWLHLTGTKYSENDGQGFFAGREVFPLMCCFSLLFVRSKILNSKFCGLSEAFGIKWSCHKRLLLTFLVFYFLQSRFLRTQLNCVQNIKSNVIKMFVFWRGVRKIVFRYTV